MPTRPPRSRAPKPRKSAALVEARAARDELRRLLSAQRDVKRLARQLDAANAAAQGELLGAIDRILRREKLIAVSQEDHELTFGRVRELELALGETRGELEALRLDRDHWKRRAAEQPV